MTLYKKVIQVDFICSNYQRLAHLALDSDMDVVYEARPLWDEVLSKYNIIIDSSTLNYSGYSSITQPVKHDTTLKDAVVLRWFDSSSSSQMEGIMTLPVEISYSSKRLDRQKKLELIGIE